MNNINYDRQMQEIIESLNGEKPKLLLHSCCAPCSSACLERIKEYFIVTVYYYNPNIDSESEYQKRSQEQVRLCKEMGVDCIVEEYDDLSYYTAVKGLEKEVEGGKRCEKCFFLRLNKSAEKCKELKFDYIATTLTVSPLKNAKLINEIGLEIAKQKGVKFLPTDFKKQGGYLRSIELSKEYDLYRQNYCGCTFSKR